MHWRLRTAAMFALLTAILVALDIAAPTLKQWAAFQKRKAEMRKGGR